MRRFFPAGPVVLLGLAGLLYGGCSIVDPDVGPTAAFTASQRSGTSPLDVAFTDQSNAGSSKITAWTWFFGDGTTTSSRNPSHTYDDPGTYTVTLHVTTDVGSDTEIKAGYITVSPKPGPNAEFSGTPTSGAKPLTVQFTDQSETNGAAITSWSWSFGDGGTSTSQNPSHVYQSSGTYNVSLTVQNPNGTDTEIKSAYVTVTAGPAAEFVGVPRSGTRPLAVQFTDQSIPGTSPITSWSWSFGDGGTSTAQSPGHTYSTAGSKTVSLTVVTAVGTDTETKTGYIVVSDPKVAPTANFSAAPRSGVKPLAVQFTDESTAGSAPISSRSWSFGDGGTSTAQNPSHTYNTAGSYTVSLTVTTADGTDTETKSGYIVVSDPMLPTAAFTGSPRSGDRPLAVQFTDQSTPGSSSITSWAWTFGDGGTSTSQNPGHTYNTAGTYTVSLTVTTSAGSDGETKAGYIVVSEPPVPPTADFTGSPLSGDRPLTVQFTDESTAGSAPITSWSWSFGDGGTGTSQSPSHTYNTAGSYTVSLAVTTADGTDSATKNSYVNVTEPPAPPTAEFSGSPTSGPLPLNVQFSDLSSPGTAPIDSWLWTFGDGATSTSQSPSHTYLLPGTYSVSLAVTTADGTGTESKPDYITVCAAPTAAFSAVQTEGLPPLSTQFTDLSVPGGGPITSWAWSFGDGGTSTEPSPTHVYETPGTYDVALTVADACGSDTETKSGLVVVQDPCEHPTYTIADAYVEVRQDSDNDGYAERARVWWNANVSGACVESVLVKVYVRPEGTTEWALEAQSVCYAISGEALEPTSVNFNGLPHNCYEIRIELYECSGTAPVATRDHLDDPDLDNRCFE